MILFRQKYVFKEIFFQNRFAYSVVLCIGVSVNKQQNFYPRLRVKMSGFR
jgi:hypothetical protein